VAALPGMVIRKIPGNASLSRSRAYMPLNVYQLGVPGEGFWTVFDLPGQTLKKPVPAGS